MPRIRIWQVAAALFTAGLCSNLAIPYPRTVDIQMLFFGGCLFVLLVWWLRSADIGPRGMLGCVGWLILAFICVIIIISSVPK